MNCPAYDIIIRNGFVVDGTGNPGFRADVGIRGDRIAALATRLDGTAPLDLDAEGKVVAPGFIDPHAHVELICFTNPTLKEYVYQGVTTVVNGNCGHSVTPYGADNVREYMYRNGLIGPSQRDLGVQWDDFAGYQDAVRSNGGTTINQATLLGHGTLRWSVMHGAEKRGQSPAETEEMQSLVAQGLDQGAVGMSTGLAYIPSSFAPTEELIEVAAVLAEHDAVYASHLRTPIGLVESVREALEIGRRAGCWVQISHLPMSYNLIADAREAGLEVAIDTIPASTGHLVRSDRMVQFTMTLSLEYFDQDIQDVLEAMKTPDGRAAFVEQNFFLSRDKSEVFLVNTNRRDWEGRSVAEVAEEMGIDATDLMFDIMLDDDVEATFWYGRHRKTGDGPHPPAESIQNRLVGPGADLLLVDPLDPTSWYELVRPGTFPFFLQMGLKSGVALEELVRRCTSLPAQTFRLRDLGLLVEGKRADVIVFDRDRFDFPNRYELDYTKPVTLATGMQHVVVNGTPVLQAGEFVDNVRPGRQLRRGQ
ncbi:MAG: amidohydrolase family protein [Bacillota bacterium]